MVGGERGGASSGDLWVGMQCGGFKDQCRCSLYCDVHMDNAPVKPLLYCEGGHVGEACCEMSKVETRGRSEPSTVTQSMSSLDPHYTVKGGEMSGKPAVKPVR